MNVFDRLCALTQQLPRSPDRETRTEGGGADAYYFATGWPNPCRFVALAIEDEESSAVLLFSDRTNYISETEDVIGCLTDDQIQRTLSFLRA